MTFVHYFQFFFSPVHDLAFSGLSVEGDGLMFYFAYLFCFPVECLVQQEPEGL